MNVEKPNIMRQFMRSHPTFLWWFQGATLPLAIVWGIGEALWNIIVDEIPVATRYWWQSRPWGEKAKAQKKWVDDMTNIEWE